MNLLFQNKLARSLATIAFVLAGWVIASSSSANELGRMLREPMASIQGEKLFAGEALQHFYAQRRFEFAWSQADQPRALAYALFEAIHQVRFDGLLPSDYHAVTLGALLAGFETGNDEPVPGNVQRDSALAYLDLLLTDAFFALAVHLAEGKLDPKSWQPRLSIDGPRRELVAALERAIETDKVTDLLGSFRPAAPAYHALRAVAEFYEEVLVRGGWPLVTPGSTLQLGDTGDRVAEIEQRLSAEGYRSPAAVRRVFDEELEKAVKQFQRDHGLVADGHVGPDTRREMNVPVEWRLWELAPNMERWRWLPNRLGEQYIMVNTADYVLEFVDRQGTVWRHKVIVGLPYRPTPEFSDQVRYLVFNPSWYVPPTIAVKDLLPRFRADPRWLEQRDIHVFARRDEGWEEVDRATIDWNAVPRDSRRFPYRLRQAPGPLNPLGKVKFMFPNQYDVYLHDTPAVELFDSTVRTFSSGCIRVERALELAENLLRETPGWEAAAIQRTLASGRETVARLTASVPIYIYYWTVWPDANGRAIFRPDVYRRDAVVLEALLFPIN